MRIRSIVPTAGVAAASLALLAACAGGTEEDPSMDEGDQPSMEQSEDGSMSSDDGGSMSDGDSMSSDGGGSMSSDDGGMDYMSGDQKDPEDMDSGDDM